MVCVCVVCVGVYLSMCFDCSRVLHAFELPEVARGYLTLRGARLGPERKAIVLAAASLSFSEQSIAQALRATCPHNLASTKKVCRW